MICAFCDTNEADKKNTHYFTDAIIRSALNVEGSNEREKAFTYDMSNTRRGIDFRFQRGTPVERIEEQLGRPANDAEIEASKEPLFSVDNVFCSSCENDFTKIENPFIEQVLPKLRNIDHTGIEELDFEDLILIRLFFYLQLWRASICVDSFDLKEDVKLTLKKLLKEQPKNRSEYNEFPMIITYLTTLGGDYFYTENIVGTNSQEKPYLVHLNDFVVEMFDSKEDITFNSCFGLHEEATHSNFINLKEEAFRIKIVNNSKRKEFNLEVLKESKGIELLGSITETFSVSFLVRFGKLPEQKDFERFKEFIFKKDENVLAKIDSKYLGNLIEEYFK